MAATIGHGVVVIGLAVSLFAAAASILAGRSGDAGLAAAGRRAVYGDVDPVAASPAGRWRSLLNHDFSILYVARNNATTTPPFYSFISLWAALEGSILFWTFLLTGWSSLLLYRYRSAYPELMPWATATLALVAAFFFAVMTWPSDPFVSVTPVTVEGNGPNALLQNHPFMGLHPPLLYLGYTGLALPFALTVAALVTRRLDPAWLRVVRRWTLGPWIFLTAGIVAGAWWSYEVLGWGGYWAWDPVENAALLPWLTATAFIHSAIVAERGRSLRTWTTILVTPPSRSPYSGRSSPGRAWSNRSIRSPNRRSGPGSSAGVLVSLVAGTSADPLAPAGPGGQRPSGPRQPRIGVPAEQPALHRAGIRRPVRDAVPPRGRGPRRGAAERRRAVVRPGQRPVLRRAPVPARASVRPCRGDRSAGRPCATGSSCPPWPGQG